MPRVRVRQHVNPLSNLYQNPIEPPNWAEIYADANQPLHLDIGCAKGLFILEMAQLETNWNFLGLEIREPLVVAANAERDERNLKNLHYLFCNANNSLSGILASFPQGILQRVTIQFPDPWFKKRHYKRRMVQPEMVDELAQYLDAGSEVLIQSDVQAVAVEIRDRFQQHPDFQQQHEAPWLAENPLPVATERELATLSRGEPVYRALFVKKSDRTEVEEMRSHSN